MFHIHKILINTLCILFFQFTSYGQESQNELLFDVTQIRHVKSDTIDEVTIVFKIYSEELSKAEKLIIQIVEAERETNILNSSIILQEYLMDKPESALKLTEEGCSIMLKNLKIQEFYVTLSVLLPGGILLSSQKLVKI